jgi:SfnB family sulfur acquisition oxidoreductase
MTTIPNTVQLIRSDAQALEVAWKLSEHFTEGAIERDRTRSLPYAQMQEYSSSGLSAITVPKVYGGADVSFETLTEVFRIISIADPCIGQIPQTHFGAINSLRTIGTPAQKEAYFARVLAGDRFGSATSERGTRHARDFKTRVHREGNHWRLQGVKFYCTGALFADWVQVLALDEEERLTRIFVPSDADGVTRHNDWTGFGQRTTASGTVTFDNVRIEDAQILPAHLLFDGKITLQGPVAQIMQAAIDAGIAEAAFNDARAFVKTRSRPWVDSGKATAAEDPHLISSFGNLSVRIAAANALLRRAARILDQASAHPITAQSAAEASVAVAEAKVLTTNLALDASEKLFELSGTSAASDSFGLDRHWRNARTHTLHDPVRWKYKVIGNFWLNDVHPDRHSFV